MGRDKKENLINQIIKIKTMKTTIKLIAILVSSSLLVTSCDKDDDDDMNAPITYYQTQDQMGRPAINTVFVTAAADKDAFNVTVPSAMGAAFQSKFQARLLALNPGYTTNLLMLDAAGFSGALATDVLTAARTGTTTFYDGNPANTLSGRTLADDVINVELILIFGGPTGASNPGLTNDNVNSNDKAFSATFPYLASPF
jgi:Domain of unknown function (DUF4331)